MVFRRSSVRPNGQPVSPGRRAAVRGTTALLTLAGTVGLIAIVATNPAAASGAARYVANGGSDTSNNCTSSATPCATISNAVSQANSGDTIYVAGTIDDHVTIGTSLTITQWFNHPQAVVDGTTSGTPFTINSGTVILNQLTIQNGLNASGNGGGIDNEGDLTLQNSTVSGNTTADGAAGCDGNAPGCTNTTGGNGGSGGGIENTGTLTVTDSTISNNSTGAGGQGGVGSGAGCAAGGTGGAGGAGGGIDNQSILTITGSTVSGNTTGGGGHGGTTSCPPSTGGAGGAGGSGAGLESTGPLTVSTSTVSGNTTGQGGDGNAGQSSFGPPGNGGQGGDGGSGGGLEANSASVTLATSTISGNTTGGGGTGGAGGNVTASTPITGANGGNGGAGGNGAGLDDGTVTISASTISANAVGTGASGGTGGTGFQCGGEMSCFPLVPSDGAHGSTGSNGDGAGTNGATMTPLADIISNQTSGANCGTSGTVTDEGYNLTDDPSTGNTCAFTQSTDVINANPNLGSLANNGGPTQTMLPPNPSPEAFVIPNPTSGICPRTDQRGVPSPSGGACTIGAVEAIPGVAPSLPSGQTFTYTTGEFDTFSITATGTPTPTITHPYGSPGDGKIPNGLTLSLSPGGATISGTPFANAGGTYNIKLVADNGVSPASTQTVSVVVQQPPVMSLPKNGGTVGFKAGVASSVPWSVYAPATTWPHITQPVTYTTSGLPTGVTFNNNGNGTGTLSGTLSKNTWGPITITATNSVGSSSTSFYIKAS